MSYSAGFEYKLSDDDLVYVKTDKGFRAGGENLKSAGDVVAFQPFKPETIYSYEMGAKTESFDRRLRVDADYFYSLTHDMQQQTVVSSRRVALHRTSSAMPARRGFRVSKWMLRVAFRRRGCSDLPQHIRMPCM